MLGGVAAILMKLYLLVQAVRARRVAIDRGVNAPERLVADDTLIDNSFRLILALTVTGLGVLFVMAVFNAPPPANDTYDLSTAAIALLALLGMLALVEVMQGIRGIVNLQRLYSAVAQLREPPEACTDTTFEKCPFITPERLLKIRADARALAADVEEITEELLEP